VPSLFSDLGVPDAVAARLAARGLTEAFPIQAATLPDALAGRDVCGRAPTGSGKTIAFGIPLVTRVGRAKPRRPRGLVLVPTRELANQVCDELAQLAGRAPERRGADRSAPSVATFFGGVGFGAQLKALSRGVDIAVACPGRLADLVNRGDIHLDDVELVVIDEADRMADMGFLPEVRRLLDRVRPDRQTLLFSATLDGDVDVLVKRYQRRPVRHELAVDEDEPTNEHVFWRASRETRLELTARVVRRQWPAIVFCRTKRGADRFARRLSVLGVPSAAIHGDRSQN
jgi:superfamily II DNA/RNA helicase